MHVSKNVGGLDDFLKTIETELKPRIALLAPTDPANQAITGGSLGGLAVLHALFVEPNAFRSFIIASPSIWWNNRAVLADEANFAADVSAGRASPHVLLTIGSEESTPPKVIPSGWNIDHAALAAEYSKARMVENSRELAARLEAIHGSVGYVFEYAVFDKQLHSLSAWPTLGRGIPFAFPAVP